MAFLIVTASLSEEIFIGSSIPRFYTIFPKYLLKISTLLFIKLGLLGSTISLAWCHTI